MELNQVRYFLALAETLSFTKAAEQCGVTQPTMSRGIKLLEQEFGAELVRRERGHTHLTELGHIIKPGLEKALALMDSVHLEAIDFSTMTKATLKLGIMCTIGPARLIPIISHLTMRVPQLNLELLEAPGDHIIESLVGGSIDVALVGLPKYPEIVSISPIYDEQYVVAFPAGHRFEKMDSVQVSELHEEPYLERLNCEYMSHYDGIGGSLQFAPEVRYRSEHEDWIQAMVIAGMGCSCMPEYMSLFPQIMKRPLVDPVIKRTISVATMRGRRHTPAIDLFTRLCMEFHRDQQKPTV